MAKTNVSGPKRGAALLVSVFTVAVLVLTGWFLLNKWFEARARAEHLRNGKAYAARSVEQVGVLPAELHESSGVAVSHIQPNVLWTHNDSGDAPNLYAIDAHGRLLATIRVTNAEARDWEDIASGPCPDRHTATSGTGQNGSEWASRASSGCLYLADTGNNNRDREILTIYIVPEPLLDRRKHAPAAIEARAFRYRYPDTLHDSEALAVLPNGDVTIVSKDRTGTMDFFRISALSISGAIATGEVLTAHHEGNMGIEPDGRIGRLATGAAVSPDGKTLAVRTYDEVFFYSAVMGERGMRWQNLGRPCFIGDVEPQGEAIDYLDSDTMLLTSERARGRPAVLHRLRC